MYRKLKISLISVFCLLFSFSFVFGEVAKGDLNVGVNYPGLSVRYFLGNKTALEVKGQFDTNIVVAGFRGYYYFKSDSAGKFLPFAGLEADFVTFKGDVSKGTGIAGELFIGGEYSFSNKLSIQLDLGPGLVSLKDNNTSESVNGLEYVVNFGINYYLGK